MTVAAPPPEMELEDRDTDRLVERIQGGDESAFAALYERYFDRVYGYVKVMIRDPHETEDVAQQVFIQVLQALPRYERRNVPFRAWLFRIARNQGLMQVRKQRRVDISDPADLERYRSSNGDHVEDDPGSRGWDPELVAAVQKLSESQRQVLLLRYMLDLPMAEIGAVLDRSEEAVRKLHQRALGSLGKGMTEARAARSSDWPASQIAVTNRPAQAFS